MPEFFKKPTPFPPAQLSEAERACVPTVFWSLVPLFIRFAQLHRACRFVLKPVIACTSTDAPSAKVGTKTPLLTRAYGLHRPRVPVQFLFSTRFETG